MKMKGFKNTALVLIVVFSLNSCDFGLKQELDKECAENLIQERKDNFNETEKKECNAQEVILVDGDYLFVVNSFNGDFNGYVYSKKTNPEFKKMRFDDFYISHHDNTEGLWTKVYGKW